MVETHSELCQISSIENSPNKDLGMKAPLNTTCTNSSFISNVSGTHKNKGKTAIKKFWLVSTFNCSYLSLPTHQKFFSLEIVPKLFTVRSKQTFPLNLKHNFC